MTINEFNFAGKKAIVRVDFNVPLKDGVITDDTRIRGALPTLKKILADGGAVIIMSHMGKPKGKVKPELSLAQIKDAVAAALGVAEVKFAPDCAKAQEAAASLKAGEVLLLENVRFYPGDESKDAKEKEEYSKQLASYGDVYVNDAFGTAHRAHATTAGLADVGSLFSGCMVGDKAFEAADGNGGTLLAKDALAFALLFLRAYSSTYGRQRGIFQNNLICAFKIFLFDLLNELRNLDSYRAALNAFRIEASNASVCFV